MDAKRKKRVVIMGAGGRDFHDFNRIYRDDPDAFVVAFTATQIPGISGRHYPRDLAGPQYPQGIPIVEEADLESLCQREHVDQVVFAYSDVPHEAVMHAAARVQSVGADFILHGPKRTMLTSKLPVLAVCAVRTGCGKSQIARWICERLEHHGVRAAVIRHPMPYGNLQAQAVQRLATDEDLANAKCTAEEREEYEPYIERGHAIFAGVDYARILEAAEAESDVVIWDGGNNDFPFLKPDLLIAVVDALRPDHCSTHHPGETVARMADVIVINKVAAAASDDVQRAIDNVRLLNTSAEICRGASPVTIANPDSVLGRRALVIEDGPTITHGGMAYGAGYVAAVKAGAGELVDPRLSATPEIQEVYAQYPHIGRVLPAMGYSEGQLRSLETTINRSVADVVICGTPCDLARLIHIDKPVLRVRYQFAEAGEPSLGGIVDAFTLHHCSSTIA